MLPAPVTRQEVTLTFHASHFRAQPPPNRTAPSSLEAGRGEHLHLIRRGGFCDGQSRSWVLRGGCHASVRQPRRLPRVG